MPKRARGSGPWHPQVTAWWKAIWRSPMAGEFLETDVLGGLYCLAELYHRRWTTTDGRVLVSVVAEIRLQEVRFGLTPDARQRLNWEIEAAPTTAPHPATPPGATDRSGDPRSLLQVLK